MNTGESPYKRLLEEVNQGHSLRKPIYEAIENQAPGNVKVVSFFTSFVHPVILDDSDAVMLEEVLMNTPLDGKKLILILNCPGGDGLAAERIVNICRSYSPGGFSVIVPKMAKSAATMVCLGADEIIMSKTSELGPIDPQILIRDERGNPLKYQAAHEIITSYEELLKMANETAGRSDPYLQQLGRYDARDIQNIRSAQSLSENIAVNLLKKGTLKKLSEKNIREKIRPLTDPNETINHGRPLFHDAVRKCGLNVRTEDNKSALWKLVWNLYIKLHHLTNYMPATKVLESFDDSWVGNIR
ncbi:hypothetical protein LJC19_04520 [Oxalobacter sp. OttesenSCG-928-P03]|nr:hypothetical protein [Oxalobacter sp. OttesenSCG-928-P03]